MHKHSVEWCGEHVELLAGRAAHLPERRTVLVADLHFGKAGTFRSFGVPVPVGTTAHTLQRLTQILQATACEHLIVLGDLLHHRAGVDQRLIEQVCQWRAQHADVRIDNVRGNHDLHAGDPPGAWQIQSVAQPHQLGPFDLRHEPPSSHGSRARPSISGHIHPAVRVPLAAGAARRLPCFQLCPDRLVLPAFGAFTGTHVISAQPPDRVFATDDCRIVEVTHALANH